MAGKFLRKNAITDTIKSEQRTNAERRRLGQTGHPITATPCGCPDPNCGAFHSIRTDRIIPTAEQADADLVVNQAERKSDKKRQKAAVRKRRNRT